MNDVRKYSIFICIVNWNAGNQLRDCISSIGHARHDGVILSEVVIVDNGSTDDSLNGVDRLGVPVKIIRNAANRGFAAACNQGAAAGTGEYVLFLNPDTRLFDNSLSAPIAFLSRPENSRVGTCGIQLVNESGDPCLSYAKFPTPGRFVLQALGLNRILAGDEGAGHGRNPRDTGVREVDQVIGAFFLTRRTVFERLRGFDERFFVYFEEVDFALRARREGWTSVCLTDVSCMHAGGGSSRQIKSERLFYSLRSRLLYGFKHFSPFSAVALILVTVVPEFLSRVLFAGARGALQDVRHTVRGYAMLMRDMPDILRVAAGNRKRRQRNR